MEPVKGTNCAACAYLIRLCSGLDFFPADVEVRRLLVETLHCLAEDHQHARCMVSRWLETETIAPKVANFVALAAQVANRVSMPDGCGICDGAPFVIRDYASGGTNYSGAARCTCPRGEALRQLDRARESQETVKGAAKKRQTAFMSALELYSSTSAGLVVQENGPSGGWRPGGSVDLQDGSGRDPRDRCTSRFPTAV